MRFARAVTASVGFAALAGLAALPEAACLPGSGPISSFGGSDAAPPPPVDLGAKDAAPSPTADVDLAEPFSISGLVPSHGPWTGGTRALISGRGFSSKLVVWVGGVALATSDVFASDPTRAAIRMPPGDPGPTDVRIRDDQTGIEKTLAGAFLYDAIDVVPNTGATSGGTRVALHGSGTAFAAGTTVTVGGLACTDVAVADATHLACTTPAAPAGARDVEVTTAAGTLQARDAFTYNDSPDGFRGGLTGGPLAGHLRVLVFEETTGTAIAAAHVVVGSTTSAGAVKDTSASGVADFADATLTGKITVTITAKCHQPTTFVDVPVDTVTAYVSAVMDPSCGSGDPPSTGNGLGVDGGQILGELIFPSGIEFKRGDWTVPKTTRPNEKPVAYVFDAATSSLGVFNLPPIDLATTPDSAGQQGYGYTHVAVPGSATLYALAGIEDVGTNPPRFTPYVMGVVRGVPVAPNVSTTGADIQMTTLLDHQVTLVPQAPPVTSRGPDRLTAALAISLGDDGFALLPQGQTSRLLPTTPITFGGVPALDGTLAGESYVVSASAITGPYGDPPASIVSDVRSTDSNAPVTLGGFLPIPTLTQPGSATWGGTHVHVGNAGGAAIDLVEIVVSSGGGLVGWTILAPGGTTDFDLPDLATLPDHVGLIHGPIRTTAYVARIDGFQYGALRYGQTLTTGWSAYAYDAISGAY